MNRLVAVVTKGIGSIRKAIVNYMSKPNEVQVAASAVTVGGTDEEKKIPGRISWFTDHQIEESDKGPINIQTQAHIDGVKLFRSFLTSARKHSINRQLSYNKKKTQRRNWSKWKRRNR
ncbi:TPA: hypothetical protein ACXOQZ_004304 [Bacillus anthracis]